MYNSYNSARHIKALSLVIVIRISSRYHYFIIVGFMSIFLAGENFFRVVISAPITIKRTNIYIVLYSLQSIFMSLISCGKSMFLTLRNGASTYLVGQA